MHWLEVVFGHRGAVGPGQECARAVLVLLYGYLAIRLFGRRIFGKWAALDIAVAIIAGSNLSRALTGTAPLWGTLAATTLLFLLHRLLVQTAAVSPRLSRLIEGRPAELARDGRTDRAVLRRWGVTQADLEEALRSKGLTDLDQAEQLTLEPSGAITVKPRA
jgi:uncharacterized membrane protein YcaP (DUF421 family)